jgi:aminoglycoside phosphotransferase (APT) family kinase protein
VRSMMGIEPPTANHEDRDVFTLDNTAVTLMRACEAAGLDSGGSRLMRLGSNAVFSLSGAIVARISRKGSDPSEAERAVSVARWLESVDYPAVRALDVEQPIIVERRVVTFWEALSDNGDDWASAAEVADVLRRLHSLEPPADLNLPALSPFDTAEHRVHASSGLDSDDQEFLIRRFVELQRRWRSLEFSLPRGVIHGDASVGNVLRDRNGVPKLIDLDGFAYGPREWDLALTAIYYDSFGWHTRDEYEAFVDMYGFDVMEWSGYSVMRDVREFLMVTWLAQKAEENGQTAEEARKRISALRTGASRRDWKPW